MDIAVSRKDKLPHMVVSDGDQIYMYRIVDQKVEPEWSKSVRSLGRVFSLQLADLDDDGNLEVIGNRYQPRNGLNSFIISAKDGKPTMVVEYVSDFLFAVDRTLCGRALSRHGGGRFAAGFGGKAAAGAFLAELLQYFGD